MFRFSDYGIESDMIIIGIAAVLVILLVLLIVALSKIGKLKKQYNVFRKEKMAKVWKKLSKRSLKIWILLMMN